MKTAEITIKSPYGHYELTFDADTLHMEMENLGIEDITSASSQFTDYIDTGERRLVITGREVSQPARTLNRKSLIV